MTRLADEDRCDGRNTMTRFADEDMCTLNHERAMDILFTDYDFRRAERDERYDAETEDYERAMHEPSRPMGGSDHERP